MTFSSEVRDRIHQLARDWRLLVHQSIETESSVVSFVTREDQNLVLKVVKQENDEWRAGEVLSAFGPKGFPQVFEHTGGAMLIERLHPGNSLADLSLAGGDEEATEILAGVIGKMSEPATLEGCPRVEDWGKGFERYLATGDRRIARPLVDSAHRFFSDLCVSQEKTRLLHGDLHHYNVLFDSQRGWLGIDPKGVIGEVEYEIGAILRNPFERPDLFLSRSTIEKRIEQLTTRLNLNRERVVGWAFAQAVLSAIWQIEDGFDFDASNTSLKLANAISPMLTVPEDVD